MFHDSRGRYWFATNGNGVTMYEGSQKTHFTQKDGLNSDYVWKIAEDTGGNIWFTTSGGYCYYSEGVFTDYTDFIPHASIGTPHFIDEGLFFPHKEGVCFYDGSSFVNFVIHPDDYVPQTYNSYNPYAVYSVLAENHGIAWFGTQEKGVCRHNGKEFHYLTEKGLAGPAVRAIFRDRRGIYWFGNNGAGLFRYDGTELRNITQQFHLTNDEFFKEKKSVSKPGSLARVFAINEDSSGQLWVGTADAGIWRFDGKKLTNYSVKNGLSGYLVNVICRDRNRQLWFVSNGDTVFRIEGNSIRKVSGL